MRRVSILIPAFFVLFSALAGCSKKEETKAPTVAPAEPAPAATAAPAPEQTATPAATPAATPEAPANAAAANAASNVADCAKACDHAFGLIKADIAARSGQVPEEFRVKMEKSLERVKPTCLQRCNEGAVNTGCVLQAKAAADIRPCTRRSPAARPAPRAVPPPSPANLSKPPVPVAVPVPVPAPVPVGAPKAPAAPAAPTP